LRATWYVFLKVFFQECPCMHAQNDKYAYHFCNDSLVHSADPSSYTCTSVVNTNIHILTKTIIHLYAHNHVYTHTCICTCSIFECALCQVHVFIEFSVYLFVCFVISFSSPCDHVWGGADVLQLCCRQMKLCRRRLQVFGWFFET